MLKTYSEDRLNEMPQIRLNKMFEGVLSTWFCINDRQSMTSINTIEKQVEHKA